MTRNIPFIPEYITVHLGAPSENARNVTIPFSDYIANVASSEIYPTWPESALRANIYAQISFALNRIYTEYYRSRGYDFDITNSTTIDQSFVYGRDIFENIQEIVDGIFNDYIRRQGNIEPLFATYCDGIEVECNGLYQWGTVTLANQGMTPFEILKYYYGDNIEIVNDAPIMGTSLSAPPIPLRLGSAGNDVRTLQIRLNRISGNYPAIPKIVNPNGIFLNDTEEAVLEFQNIFGLDTDGVVGKATWYSIQNVYNSVKRLNDVNSEGLKLEDITQQFPEVLSEGSTGIGVSVLQYYLNYLSAFYSTIPPLQIDGSFGPSTKAAVIDAQNTFGLTPDGVVGELTWNTLYNAYLGIVGTVPVRYTEGNTIPYPGTFLSLGAESESVRVLQEFLNYISKYIPEVPPVNPTGYFGYVTQDAVIAFQNLYGINANGVVGPITWNAITSLYSDLYNGAVSNSGQYPGYSAGG